jgi:hypothetical protein
VRALLAAALIAAAVTSAAQAGTGTLVRDCAARLEPAHGPIVFSRPGDLVIGPLSLGGLGTVAPAQRFGSFFAVKAIVSVRAGRAVVLSVPAPVASFVSLAYSPAALVQRPGPLFAAVRFVPCAPQTPAFSRSGTVGPVTQFGGVIVFTRPGCYPLDVRVDGGARFRGTVRLARPHCR